MKKIVLIMLFFLLVGCTKTQYIDIGVVGTMSGSASDLSISGRRGIELAVDKINGEGGIDGKFIRLVVKNDENMPERSNEIVTEFVDEDIDIVIGPYTSGMMLSAYDSLIENEILYVAPTVSADSLSFSDDNFIRFIASTAEQAYALGKVANSNNHKNFIVIFDGNNIGFNKMLFDNFKSEIEKINGEILEDYSFKQLDDKTIEEIINTINNYDELDAIFIIAGSNDFGKIAQNIRLYSPEYPLYGPLWAHTNDLLRVGGKSIENAYIVSGIDFHNSSRDYIRVKDEHIDKYGSEITFAGLYSYEAMMAIAQAIENVGSTDYLKIKEEIIRIGQFEGLQDSFTIDQYGDNTRKYTVDQVLNGRYIKINE